MDNEHIAATQQNPQGHRTKQDAVTASQTDEQPGEPLLARCSIRKTLNAHEPAPPRQSSRVIAAKATRLIAQPVRGLPDVATSGTRTTSASERGDQAGRRSESVEEKRRAARLGLVEIPSTPAPTP